MGLTAQSVPGMLIIFFFIQYTNKVYITAVIDVHSKQVLKTLLHPCCFFFIIMLRTHGLLFQSIHRPTRVLQLVSIRL